MDAGYDYSNTADDVFTYSGMCIPSNQTLNDFFGDPGFRSCCMKDVCGLECPVPVDPPPIGYGIAVIIAILLFFVIGVGTFVFVQGQSVNYFVAGRALPLYMVIFSLACQAIDSNALLGNMDLAYRFGFWDGAVIPIGLGLSLVLNSLILAHHINDDKVLTLPDVFAKRYGRVVEILVSLATITSITMLLAGNLLGFGAITSQLWDISESLAIWTGAAVVWVYTACGGLYSIAFSDIAQGLVGWSGAFVMCLWFLHNENPIASPVSIGFPSYKYSDIWGDGGGCDLYDGVPCTYNSSACCYNTDKWCPGYDVNPAVVCERYDRGAYPFADQISFRQMTDPLALAPFPNAMLWNWATIFILAFGNLAALDFQARCMASKSPKVARIACFTAGCIVWLIGIPFSYLAAVARQYYGPDSIHSKFAVDSCQANIGLPTCALWIPDVNAFVKLLTNHCPPFIGAWGLIGVVSASMSTADGAILAVGTVFSHNVLRQLDGCFQNLVKPENLLFWARVTTIPFTLASTLIAIYYRTSDGDGGTGYLLIVAFDVVLATVVVPLIGCYYCRTPSPRAALLAILSGAVTRITLEFVLPKDGSLIYPHDDLAFYDVGPAASVKAPSSVDVPADQYWDPSVDTCQQEQFMDYTGADSLTSFGVCLVVFLSVQALEFKLQRPLFMFGGSKGYQKETSEHAKTPKQESIVDENGLPIEFSEADFED